MKELITRLANPSPTFFKKIQVIGVAVLGIGTALVATPGLPAIITTIGGYLITGGTIATIIAKFTVTDSSVLPNKDERVNEPK